MTGFRRLAVVLAASVGGALALLTGVPVPSGGVGESLSLTPDSGPPGSTVAWVASGFAACPGTDDVGVDGVVSLRWDGTDELDRADVSDDGTAASEVLVPESASLEAHRLTAACVLDDAMTAQAQFTVTPPESPQVSVPNVIGASEGEARSRLEALKFTVEATGEGGVVQGQDPSGGILVDPGAVVTIDLGQAQPDTVQVPSLVGLRLSAAQQAVEGADLELGGVSGDHAGLVSDQSPGPGEEVPLGTIVSISLQPVVPPVVRVPQLVGERLEDVPAILVAEGLTLGLVTGSGDVVRSQRPAAGRAVPADSEVNVSVEAGEAPDALVPVPDVVGGSGAEARAALESVGLAVGGDALADARVSGQQPAAETLVPRGTTVTLVLQPRTPGWGWVLGGVVVVLAAGTVAATLYRPVRRSMDRRWVRAHVTIRPGPRPQAAVTGDAQAAGSAPTRVVRLVPRRDPGTHHLEELGP